MVKITNLTKRELRRRLPNGQSIKFGPGATVEVTSQRLLAVLKASRAFTVEDEAGSPDVGGGLKTHSRPPKARRTSAKSKKEVSLKSKLQKKVDRVLKKPKGLRKSKRAD